MTVLIPPNDKCLFCSLFRHELPVFGVLGRWKRRDVHELARHKTTSTWRRGQTKISLCGESAHFLLSKLKNKTFVYKVLTTLFEDNVHRILRGSHFLQIPWRFQNDQIWFPYLKKFIENDPHTLENIILISIHIKGIETYKSILALKEMYFLLDKKEYIFVGMLRNLVCVCVSVWVCVCVWVCACVCVRERERVWEGGERIQA